MSAKFGELAIIHRGGGMNGAIGVGILHEFAEQGIFDEGFKYAQGVSVGALNVASLIAGLGRGLGRKAANPLVERWLSLARDKRGEAALFQPIRFSSLRSIPSLYTDAGLKELIHGARNRYVTYQGIDAKMIVDSPIHFDIGVTREKGRWRNHEMVSNHDEAIKKSPDKLLSFLQASASIPPFFPPVCIDKKWYMDGLCLKFRPAFNFDCKTIFLILNDHTEFADDCEVVTDWHERSSFAHNECNDELLAMRLRYIRDDLNRGKVLQISAMGSNLPFLEKVVNTSSPKPLYDDSGKLLPRIIIVAPTKWIKGLNTTGFTKSGIEAGIEHGRERAKAVLAALSEQ